MKQADKITIVTALDVLRFAEARAKSDPTFARDLRAARFGLGQTFETIALDFMRLACRYSPR
jgi:hypothetical protein